MATLADHRSATIRRRTDRRSLRRRDGLVRHARDVTSQGGEDGIIARLFDDLLPPPEPSSRRRWCVDVGAWDGVHLSNTHSLLVGRRGEWSGVLIEADSGRFLDLEGLHGPLGNVCVRAEVSCLPGSVRSLASILKRDAPRLPRDFDFLSIDVDGADYWLLADVLGLTDGGDGGDGNSRYRPKVVCVEFNPTMPVDLIYVQPRGDGVRHGSSLSAMVELVDAAGYVLVETTLFNAFFVRRELHEQYLAEEVPDTSIEALHEVTMGTELYQLYDGTVKLWGCKKMLWHRLPIDEGRMQPLLPGERTFPFAPAADGGGWAEEGRPGARSEGQRVKEMAIDMSPYCPGLEASDECNADSLERKRDCYTRLNDALRTDGFALVRGTGISGALCSNALRAAGLFLNEADEPVRRSCLTGDRARRGYSPSCTENFASLLGERAPNDLVRKFRVGPKSSPSSLHSPNAWPPDEVWGCENASFFRSSVESYFEAACDAADSILKAIYDGIFARDAGISESIKVFSEPPNLATDGTRDHTSILTLLGYRPGSRHKRGSKGYMRPLVSAHTDVGVITLLVFDGGRCASLQRAANVSGPGPGDAEWIDVNLPLPGEGDDPVLVVNVGDCLSEISGGTLRSTLHQVVPRPLPAGVGDAARSCLALFVGLEPGAALSLPSGEAVTYEEWRKRRIARAMAVLKRG